MSYPIAILLLRWPTTVRFKPHVGRELRKRGPARGSDTTH